MRFSSREAISTERTVELAANWSMLLFHSPPLLFSKEFNYKLSSHEDRISSSCVPVPVPPPTLHGPCTACIGPPTQGIGCMHGQWVDAGHMHLQSQRTMEVKVKVQQQACSRSDAHKLQRLMKQQHAAGTKHSPYAFMSVSVYKFIPLVIHVGPLR